MTYNETRAWLLRAQRIDQEITVLTRKHYEAYSRVTAITAQTDGVVTSATKDPHRKNDELAALSFEIQSRINELNKAKKDIIKAISLIDNQQYRIILTERFIPDETGRVKREKDLAAEMHIDERHIRRLQQKAINELKDVLECPPA